MNWKFLEFWEKSALPKANSKFTRENQWLEDEFPFRMAVSGRVSPKVHIQQLKAGVLEAKFIQRRHSQWITTNPWHPDMFHKLPLNFGMASQRVPWKDSEWKLSQVN